MTKRGRPSAASLITIPSPLETVARIRPPHDLHDEEVEVWVSVVESEPADWFSPATVPLLTQYCRHVVHARRIAELLEKATSDPTLAIEDYDRLLKMQERESRAQASLATKMRLTHQATANARGNKKPQARKPWEG